MIRRARSRLDLLAVAALAAALSACTGSGPTGAAPVTPPAASPSATEPPPRMTLMQHVGDDTSNPRRLAVEPDGSWHCDNCAGDGKESEGRLAAEQTVELHRMLADPELGREIDERHRKVARCSGALYSTLLTGQGVISVADCPGEPRLRVTDAILHLLADATPVEVTRLVDG